MEQEEQSTKRKRGRPSTGVRVAQKLIQTWVSDEEYEQAMQYLSLRPKGSTLTGLIREVFQPRDKVDPKEEIAVGVKGTLLLLSKQEARTLCKNIMEQL